MASLSFSTSASVNGTDSSININSHGIAGVQEIRYEYGDNASPTSIGLAQGIFYALAKDSNSIFVIENLDNVKYFISGFEDTIDLIENTISIDHSFSTGDKVVYNNNGGTDLGGISSFSDYYVIVVSATKIKLASTLSNSSNNIPIQLSSTGSGYSQCLFKKKTITPSATNQTHKIIPNFRQDGVLIIKSITTLERNNISPLINGMVIYNSTTNKFQGRENNAWVNLYEPTI